MTNPPILVITGLGGYFILNFLQKSGYKIVFQKSIPFFIITSHALMAKKERHHKGVFPINNIRNPLPQFCSNF